MKGREPNHAVALQASGERSGPLQSSLGSVIAAGGGHERVDAAVEVLGERALPLPRDRRDHMPRAVGCFRRVGFDVLAYPVDWRTRGAIDLVFPFATVAGGLGRTDAAVREWVGLVTYWLTGKTSELFPGPSQARPAAAAADDKPP